MSLGLLCQQPCFHASFVNACRIEEQHRGGHACSHAYFEGDRNVRACVQAAAHISATSPSSKVLAVLRGVASP